jgi:hypothetical protein
LEKPLSIHHERITDAYGCFSLQNFLFRIQSGHVIAKKKISVRFSHKIGSMACYDKTYYPVSLLGFSNKNRDIHIPDVTKALLYRYYLTGVRAPAVGDGEAFPREFTALLG